MFDSAHAVIHGPNPDDDESHAWDVNVDVRHNFHCSHASWIVNEEDPELHQDLFVIQPEYEDGLRSNDHAVTNADASLGYSRSGKFPDISHYEFEKLVVRKLTRDPEVRDAPLNVEIMRRLTWINDEPRSLLNCVLGSQLQCFGRKSTL